MRKRFLVAFVCIFLLVGPMAIAAGKIITPPQIMMPYGADVVTEISISDNDLLKVVKGTIPIIGEVIKGGIKQGLGSAIQQKAAPGTPDMSAAFESIDVTPLSEAIEKVDAVRILIAKYPNKVVKKDLLNALDAGTKKMGSFKRIISDIQFSKGVLVVYAENNDKGYLAYMYEPNSKMLYAGRLAGFLDVQKIMAWGMELTTKFMTIPAGGVTKEELPSQQPTTDAPSAPVPEGTPAP